MRVLGSVEMDGRVFRLLESGAVVVRIGRRWSTGVSARQAAAVVEALAVPS